MKKDIERIYLRFGIVICAIFAASLLAVLFFSL